MQLAKYFVGFLFLWFFSFFAQAQNGVVAEGRFLASKVKVGEPVQYILRLQHSPEQEILFPDSIHQDWLKPFEVLDKHYFPTRTLKQISIDSAVYTLATYETDSIQSLEMPVFVLSPQGDTSVIKLPKASLLLVPTVLNLPDSVKTIENTQYLLVGQAFNYARLLVFLFLIALVALVFFFIFGGRIRRSYRLQRIKRQYERFTGEYDKLIRDNNLQKTEHGVLVWKAYLENLQTIPYTTFTTKEMEKIIPDEQLTESLKNIDKAIYGNLYDEQTRISLLFLKIFATNAYETKIKEVRGE